MMNYLTEINAFYRWSEINAPSKSEIALWHAFMHLNNISEWQVVFTARLSTVASKAGLSIADTKRYRNRLSQRGRILWKERKGNQSALYVIIPFDDVERESRLETINKFVAQYEPQVVPQTVPQSAPQIVPQPVPISKLKETTGYRDINNNNNAHARDPDDEPYEFVHGVFLSSRQLRDLTEMDPKGGLRFVHYYTDLSRKKSEEGYKPSGSDYEELKKMIQEDRKNQVSYG